MRYLTYIVLTIIALSSCGNIGSDVEKDRLHVLNQKSPMDSIPEWMTEGVDAYGLIVYTNNDIPVYGKPIPCKILKISRRGVKCMATEKVALFDQFNCYKIGIEKDEIWFDLPTELYRTEKEALDVLRQKNLLLTVNKIN